MIERNRNLYRHKVLIVPLWNWNTGVLMFRGRCRFVLIVPLWNWNKSKIYNIFFNQRSNRTFMELKLPTPSFARMYLAVLIVPLWNWNVRFRRSMRKTLNVLIVPLWNWNEEKGILDKRHSCSNRTFMELKWLIAFCCCINFCCSNRTFMELKFN